MTTTLTPNNLTSLVTMQDAVRSQLATCQSVLFYTQAVIGDYKSTARLEDYLGWLLCDGRSLNRVTYSALFDIIGTSFGSASGSTFNLPDFRGKVFGGVNIVANKNNSFSTRNVGDFVGEEVHTLTVNEMPSHDHGGSTGTAGFNTSVQTMSGGGGADAGDNTGSHTHTISSQGGGLAHNNMQPTLFGGNIMIFAGLPGTLPGEEA